MYPPSPVPELNTTLHTERAIFRKAGMIRRVHSVGELSRSK